MLKTTLGQLLINDALPADLQDYNRVLTKKNMTALATEIARRYPDKYRDITKRLQDVGRDTSYTTNGLSVGLDSIRPTISAIKKQHEVRQRLRGILADRALSDKARNLKILEMTSAAQKELVDSVYKDAEEQDNPLFHQVSAGIKGNKFQLNSLLGADLQYVDHKNDPIPIPVMRSYSQGLRPVEYFAGAFGTRKGLIDLKTATSDAGFFAKQLTQMNHRLLVTKDDDDDVPDEGRGYPTDVDDVDNEGALLARGVGPYKRNTILTPKILKDLKNMGIADILVRSPTVGGPDDGGVFAKDVGYREKDRLPPIGDYVGIAAAQALAEPVTQAQISSKHCLAVGTLVRMADWSVKRIEDIRVGDVVLGADKNAHTFPSCVVRTYDNGTRECARTIFRVPYSRTGANVELVSTLDHKVLMFRRVTNALAEANNWTPQVLPVGTATGKLVAIMPRGFDDSFANMPQEPFALLIGLLLGDGCYTHAIQSVNFSCFDPTLIEDVQPLIAPLNLKLSKLKGHPGYYKVAMRQDDYYTRRDSRTGQMLAGTRNPVRQWLESRGMYGKYAHEKILPAEVWSWDNASVAQLIAGYFVTDGSVFVPGVNAHISKPYLSFVSTSRTMLEQVQQLLAQRFGIYSTGPYANNTARKRTLYSINISAEESIRRFYAVIPLYGVKRRTFDDLLQNWRVESPRPFTRYPRQRPELVGQLRTYDIEVENADHLFVLANGLIVSNSGGVGGAGSIAGFKALNALVQVPEKYPNGATHSTVDGTVQEIRPAAQGGNYVTVNGVDHYVPTDVDISVKKGDTLEAGDVVSAGMPSPGEIVKHKGIGEGRRYFVQAMRQVMQNSGITAHRRNIELLSRGLINHVRLTDEYGDYVPDDVVPYSALEKTWQPRTGSVRGNPKGLTGHYLEKPVLHYSIGTKIGKSVVDNLNKYGVKDIEAHKEPPPFEPEMVRGMANVASDPDWMTRMLGSYQQKSLLGATHRGGVSDTAGTSFVPTLARGETFGLGGATSGWKP
jgi:hypothetical protein